MDQLLLKKTSTLNRLNKSNIYTKFKVFNRKNNQKVFIYEPKQDLVASG